MRLSNIIFGLILISNFCFAQMTVVDSIKQKLSYSEPDSSRVNLYNSLVRKYNTLNIDSANLYNQRALRLSKKINFKNGLAEAYYRQGEIQYRKGKYKDAIFWLDSCRMIRKELKDLSGAFLALGQIGSMNEFSGEYQQAYLIYREGLLKSELNGLEKNILQFRFHLGQYFNTIQDFDSAMHHLGIASDMARDIKDIEWQMRVITVTGNVYWRKQDHLQAFNYYRNGLELAMSVSNEKMINDFSGKLAMIYNVVGLVDRAIEIWQELASKYNKSGQVVQEGFILRHLASAYSDSKNFEKSNEYSLLAMEKLKDSPNNLILLYNILSHNYLELEKLELAQINAEKTLDLAEKYENAQYRALSKARIGRISMRKGDLFQARDLYMQALDNLDYVFPITANYIHTDLALVSNALNDPQKAYYHLNKALSYRDSMITESETKALVRSSIEFETEKKERALYEAEKEAQIQTLELDKKELQIARTNFIFMVGIILLLAIGFIIFLVNSRKQLKLKTEAVLSQQQSLRLQMNPHFIFNALASIQDFMNEVSVDKANGYLIKFGRLMRQTLENSRTEFISISSEIQSIQDYLELQKLYHNDGFEYEVMHDFEGELEDYQMPPMFVQPFVENAIEHGISSQGEAKITVAFSALVNEVKITIKDTGRSDTQERNSLKVGYEPLAKKIVEERIYHLNRIEKTNARINVQMLKTGTQVTLFLPLIEH